MSPLLNILMKKLYLLLFVCGSALADDAAILHCRGMADAAGRLSCYDALDVSGATAAPPVSRQEREKQFGLERLVRKEEPASIESHIQGHFEGWRANEKITLANGQVWQVSDDSDAFANADNPKVTIVRGMLGAIFLEVEGTTKSPRVRRIR